MQDALSVPDNAKLATEVRNQSNLVLRHDTLLGVCEGIGQEFGFNPNFLRVPFAAGILWNPVVMVGIYLGLGVALAVARWFYPKAQPTTVSQAFAGHSAHPAADNVNADELHAAA
ncbi:MAG: PspC domain-containing protein [Sphingomicrobium sp.]